MIPKGWKLDVDAANRRFRICVDPGEATGSKDPLLKSVPAFCSPWIEFDDVLAELSRMRVKVQAEGKRFWKRVAGWFGKGD